MSCQCVTINGTLTVVCDSCTAHILSALLGPAAVDESKKPVFSTGDHADVLTQVNSWLDTLGQAQEVA